MINKNSPWVLLHDDDIFVLPRFKDDKFCSIFISQNKFIFYKMKSFEVLHMKENDVSFTRGGIFLSKIGSFR